MTDVFKDLALGAGWRQIGFPISARDFGFSHEQAKHRFIFRDQQLIESLGRENPTYTYTIPFREDIAKGPYENLFTQVYPEFLAACLDRSRGKLDDPFHGVKDVKCVSLRELADANKRDGIDVEVSWIVSPTASELTESLGDQIGSLQGAENSAGAFDREVQKIDWEQLPPPEPTVSPFDFVTGVIDQGSLAVNKVDAAIAQSISRAARTVETIDKLKRPDLAITRAQGRRLQAALTKILEKGSHRSKGRRIKTVTTQIDYTQATLASRLGLTMEQLHQLNPQLRRYSLIKAGTQVRTYT